MLSQPSPQKPMLFNAAKLALNPAQSHALVQQVVQAAGKLRTALSAHSALHTFSAASAAANNSAIQAAVQQFQARPHTSIITHTNSKLQASVVAQRPPHPPIKQLLPQQQQQQLHAGVVLPKTTQQVKPKRTGNTYRGVRQRPWGRYPSLLSALELRPTFGRIACQASGQQRFVIQTRANACGSARLTQLRR